MGYIGAPVLDLMYFTLTSTNNEIKLGKFPEILVMYHKHLAQCLKQMEYKEKIPTLFELYSQYIEKSFYGKFCIFYHEEDEISLSAPPKKKHRNSNYTFTFIRNVNLFPFLDVFALVALVIFGFMS